MEQKTPNDTVEFFKKNDDRIRALEQAACPLVSLDSQNLILNIPLIAEQYPYNYYVEHLSTNKTIKAEKIKEFIGSHLPELLENNQLDVKINALIESAGNNKIAPVRRFLDVFCDARRKTCEIISSANGCEVVIFKKKSQKTYKHEGCQKDHSVNNPFWMNKTLQIGHRYNDLAVLNFDNSSSTYTFKWCNLSEKISFSGIIRHLCQHPTLSHHAFIIVEDFNSKAKKVWRLVLKKDGIQSVECIAEKSDAHDYTIHIIRPHDSTISIIATGSGSRKNSSSYVSDIQAFKRGKTHMPIKLSLHDCAQRLKKIDAFIALQAKKLGIAPEKFKDFRTNHPYRQNFITNSIARALIAQSENKQ